MKNYTLKNILEQNAVYNIIIGSQGIGKTYAVLNYGIEQFIATRKKIAIIRRYKEDLKKYYVKYYISQIKSILKKFQLYENYKAFYQYDRIYIYDGLNKIDLVYFYALENIYSKYINPSVYTILFDDFLASRYLPYEFNRFMNNLYDIARGQDNIKIFMVGNPISADNPYFNNMKLDFIKDMKSGDIKRYQYNDDISIAVEIAKYED